MTPLLTVAAAPRVYRPPESLVEVEAHVLEASVLSTGASRGPH